MNVRPVVIPYDVTMEYVHRKMKKIFHDASDWGNEIVIVFEGSGVYSYNDMQFAISAGDMFVLRGDYIKEIKRADKLRLCSIYYRDESIQRLAGTFRQLDGYQKLFIENPMAGAYAPEDRLRADEDLLEELAHLVDLIIREQKLMEPGFEQIINSSFFVLITLASRAFSASENYSFGSNSGFYKAVAYMQSNYHEKIKMSDLAAIAHISERQFHRLFKIKYGIAPSQHLIRLRLKRAEVLLEESELSVSDIASECGFCDSNYFSKCFHNAHGLAPMAYREKFVEAANSSDLKRHCLKSTN